MTGGDVVAVAVLAHATSQQRLAGALLDAAAAAGVLLDLRTMSELATETVIRQEPGRPPLVDPDRPMIWLAVGDHAADDPDERFAQAESYAAARSVAILTRSPVLNRPTPFGSQGTLPMSATAALRGLTPRLRDRVRTERFTSHASPVDGEEQEVLDYATGRRSRSFEDDAGPFRSRPAGGRTAWITVAGSRTFGPDVADLHDASREVAASFGLGLAHVWWACPPNSEATVSRVDAWAWDTALGARVDGVARALVAWSADLAGARS